MNHASLTDEDNDILIPTNNYLLSQSRKKRI
jgi:hypothetical protein